VGESGIDSPHADQLRLSSALTFKSEVLVVEIRHLQRDGGQFCERLKKVQLRREIGISTPAWAEHQYTDSTIRPPEVGTARTCTRT